MHSALALQKCLGLGVNTVLDVGSGNGGHAKVFRDAGLSVTTVDLSNADICGDFLSVDIPNVDLIWCSHVLEHQPNVNLFFRKCLNHSKYLCVTVPPLKDEIVGGHLTLWNSGLLLYNLVLAGFDCREAMVKKYGYNISVITKSVRRKDVPLKMDCGDIEALSEFFPLPVHQGFDGQIEELNWDER